MIWGDGGGAEFVSLKGWVRKGEGDGKRKKMVGSTGKRVVLREEDGKAGMDEGGYAVWANKLTV